MDALEDIIFGSVAGAISKFFEYPFDTIKVRLQSQPDQLPLLYNGPLDCFRKSLKSVPGGLLPGFFSLYRGISAPLIAAIFENSSLFFWERIAQQRLRHIGFFGYGENIPPSAVWITGALAGAATSFTLTPFELVKCRVQVSHKKNLKTTSFGVFRDVWLHDGIKGFWKGQLSTFIRETMGSAAWFGSKESVSSFFRLINKDQKSPTYFPQANDSLSLPLYQQAIAGASAGVSYNFISFPADTIKSRIQTMRFDEKKKSIWSEVRTMWGHHGIKGFYRGCGITMMKSAPSSALIFCIFDGMKEHLSFSRHS